MKRILALLVTIVVFLTGCDEGGGYFNSYLDKDSKVGPRIIEEACGYVAVAFVDDYINYTVTTEEYGDICIGSCYNSEEEALDHPLIIYSDGCNLTVTITAFLKEGNEPVKVSEPVTIPPGESKLVNLVYQRTRSYVEGDFYIYVQSQ